MRTRFLILFVLIFSILFADSCASTKKKEPAIRNPRQYVPETASTSEPVPVPASGAEYIYEFDVMVDVDPQKKVDLPDDYDYAAQLQQSQSQDRQTTQARQTQTQQAAQTPQSQSQTAQTPQTQAAQTQQSQSNVQQTTQAPRSQNQQPVQAPQSSLSQVQPVPPISAPLPQPVIAPVLAPVSEGESRVISDRQAQQPQQSQQLAQQPQPLQQSQQLGQQTQPPQQTQQLAQQPQPLQQSQQLGQQTQQTQQSTNFIPASESSGGSSQTAGFAGNQSTSGTAYNYTADHTAGYTAGYSAGYDSGYAAVNPDSARTVAGSGIAGAGATGYAPENTAAYVEGYSAGYPAGYDAGRISASGGIAGRGSSGSNAAASGFGSTGSNASISSASANQSSAGGMAGNRARRNTNLVGSGSVNAEGVMDYIRIRNRNPNFSEENARRIINSYIEEAVKEDVNYDLAIAQMLYWTAFLTHRQRVDSNNLAGLDTTREWNGRFPSVSEGVQAHIQHLRGYSHTNLKDPNTRIVDPRWYHISHFRGTIKTYEQLYPRWSQSTARYRRNIILILNDMYRYSDRYSDMYR